MKDVSSQAQEAIDTGDQKTLIAERVAWRQRAKRAWVQMEATDNCEATSKLHRTKSYTWLLATDHQLWACCDRRWSHYFLPEESCRGPPEEWDTLSVSVDQGADGWQALQYLVYEKRAAVVAMKDPSHRLWRDTWLAVTHAHLKPLCILLTIVLNADHGPWQDARWYQASREAALTYMKVGGADDSLFERHMEQVAAELGMAHRLGEKGIEQELFETIPEALLRMTAKVAQSRWFGLFSSLEQFLPWWTRRYIVLAYLGLQEGLYETSGASVMAKVRPQQAGGEPSEALDGPTAREGLDIQALRRACHNTLHLCCVFLGDSDIRELLVGVLVVVQPVRREFQEQHKALRSCSGAAELYAALAGKGWGRRALADIAQMMSDGSVFAGLSVHGAAKRPSNSLLAELRSDDSHPEVVRQGILAGRLMTLGLELLKVRLRSLSWSENGYPGSFAKLLLGEEAALEHLRRMSEDWAIWKHLTSTERKDLTHLVARSCFQHTAVLKVCANTTGISRLVGGWLSTMWGVSELYSRRAAPGLVFRVCVQALPAEIAKKASATAEHRVFGGVIEFRQGSVLGRSFRDERCLLAIHAGIVTMLEIGTPSIVASAIHGLLAKALPSDGSVGVAFTSDSLPRALLELVSVRIRADLARHSWLRKYCLDLGAYALLSQQRRNLGPCVVQDFGAKCSDNVRYLSLGLSLAPQLIALARRSSCWPSGRSSPPSAASWPGPSARCSCASGRRPSARTASRSSARPSIAATTPG